jgi:RNA polymerase sigma-70 factor (ECF subfamily)
MGLKSAMAARRRSHTRSRYTEPDCSVDDIAEDEASPLASMMAGRRRDIVRQLLDELPEPIAEALSLHFVLGYTVDEIAAAVAVSPNTVWSRLRLGKQALRRKLDADARLREMLAESPYARSDRGPTGGERCQFGDSSKFNPLLRGLTMLARSLRVR